MRLYRRLLRYLLPYGRQFALALLFMLVVAVSTAGAALLVRNVLDDIFINRKEKMLWLLPGAIIGLYLVKGAAAFFQGYMMKKIGQSVVRDLRDDLFGHLQALSLSFFHRHATGSVISRFVNDALLVQEAVTIALASILRDSLTVLCLAAVIFYRDWKLASVALLILPFALYPLMRFGRMSRRVGRKSQVQVGELSTIIHENVTGAKVVRAFNMEESEKARFAEENNRLFRLYVRMKKVEALSPAVMEVLGSVGVAAVVFYGGRQVINGVMTPGTFFSFITALLLLFEPVKRLAGVNTRIQESLAASERIFSVLDTSPEVAEKPGAISLPTPQKGVEFRNVSFSYDRDPVLRNIDLTARLGEKIALVGPSGAGKSTLVNLLPRFFDPDGGSILVDGVDVREVSLHSLRSQIGIVTQETILFNDTILSNIACGRPSATRDEVEAAAAAAYAHEFVTTLPQGYDTRVGERGLMISGGERQRLCIARAILKGAPLLILDEATSALDSEAAKIVQDALENLLEEKTAFIIAHSFATVLKADRIVLLEGGRIVDAGTHGALLERSPLYRRLYDLQFRDHGAPA